MNWQTIDFQGIAGLENSLIHRLQLYLDEKESHLAQFIANSIPQMTESGPVPYLPEPLTRTKLSDGVEAFSRRAHQDTSSFQVSSAPEWQKVAGSINKAIWEYVEVLEGSAVELFQQVEQIGFEQWSPTLLQIIENIKDLLLHSMEDLKWAFKRLESQLQDYRFLSGNGKSSLWLGIKKLFSKNRILDPAIPRNLVKSQKFLNFKNQNFVHRHNEFQQLDSHVDKIMAKFSDYELLDSIDPEEGEKFKQIYRALKIWEQNSSAKVLTELELIRGIHRIISPEKASQVFKDYYQAIKNQIFNLSRQLKYRPDGEMSKTKEQIQDALTHYRLELHTLGATTAKYREFLLKSDPDPYVRTRGGFSEWVIGLEPTAAKPLLYQEYDIESLDQTILKFSESIRKNGMSSGHEELENEIWETLHDMGQPLASKQLMELRSGQFVDQLQSLDELASSDPSVVDNVTKFLSRALRADWKYNMLYDIPEFHLLYSIHQGILGPDPDRAHISRKGEFKILTERLFKWIKEKKLIRHRHEVELDINDIKESLQDMFAHVQRIAKDPAVFNQENAPNVIQDISRKLLEYRYLFNGFFHQLRGIESDEKLLRKQFLFVDHYFESIENKLIEMRNVLWD